MEHFSIGDYFDILSQSRKAYACQLEPVCQKWDLTRCGMDILLFLYNNPEFDRAADIVTRRGIAKSHVSLSVADLIRRGLLERHWSPDDRRNAHLTLTEPGRAIAAEGRAAQEHFYELIHRGISPEEMQLWESIHRRVCENILAFTDL